MRRSNSSIKLLISMLYASKDPLVLWLESVGKCVVTPLASYVFQRQSFLIKADAVQYKSWQSLLFPCNERFKDERCVVISTMNAKSATHSSVTELRDVLLSSQMF